MRLILSAVLFVISTCAFAQNSFTNHLEKKEMNSGVVTVNQSKEIEALVNGTNTVCPSATSETTAAQTAESGTDATPDGKKLKTSGYRIQVYSGGNSRNARANAYAVAEKVKRMFPELNVYTHFASPRWICRAGDFKTYEEANDVLQQMRETGALTGISIVKDQIVLSL